jgi:hypothetical protein
MKNKAYYQLAGSFQRTTLAILFAAFLCGATYGQGAGGPGGSNTQQCTATRLRFRFATSDDDLRGGQDNLNIIVFFKGGRAPQVAPNVNKSDNWPNNSVNYVDVYLDQPVPPDQIRALRLIHIADGGFNTGSLPTLLTLAAPIDIPKAFLSPDNWNMADVEVAAIGNGVGARIANHGFFRFTGSEPVLTIGVRIPANVCGSGRPTGNSGGGSGGGATNPALNPGGSGLHPVTGGTGSGAGRFGQAVKSSDSGGTLLAAGSQKTLLGDGSVRPAPAGTASPSQTTNATMLNGGSKTGSPTTTSSKVPGRSEYDAITLQRGVTQDPGFTNWVNSGQQPGTTGSAPHAGSLTAARTPIGIQANPNVYVAQACAKDSSYRVLFISGTSDGKTLTVGPHYTLSGCSFGNPPLNKPPTPPVRRSSQIGPISAPSGYYVGFWVSIKSQFTGLIYADILSWSDNAIVVTFRPSDAVNDTGTPLSGPAVGTELWLTRGDGQTVIYGHEGGLFFKPAN